MRRDGQGNYVLDEMEYLALQDHDTEAYKALAFERLGEIKKLAGELGKIKEDMRWRDAINEPPEDRKSVLFFNGRYMMIGCLIGGDGKWHCGCAGDDVVNEGNCWWVPLPDSPRIIRIIDQMHITGVSLNVDGVVGFSGHTIRSHKEVSDAEKE